MIIVRALLLALGLIACRKPAASGAPGDVPSPREIADAQVTGYSHHVDLASGVMRSDLSLEVAKPGGNCVTLPSLLPTEAATWNGAEARTEHDGQRLRFCGQDLAEGQLLLGARVRLRELPEVETGVGFHRTTDSNGYSFVYLQNWLERCDLFGPCDDAVNRLVSIAMEVTHDPAVTVLCPGERSLADGVTRCRLEMPLAPTYSGLSFIASDALSPHELLSADGMRVVLYEVPEGRLARKIDAASLREFLGWATTLLGPLPYGPELRLVGAPLNWLGYEHPANIVLSESLPIIQTEYANATQHTVMHEIVHQWSGDATTLASGVDVVWKESIAGYLTYVFEDEHRSGEAASSLRYWKRAARFADYYPLSRDEPPVSLWTLILNAYAAGTMTLFVQLESMLGREVMLSSIREFLAPETTRGVLDLKAILERRSGENLDDYFAAWVEGAGTPSRPQFETEVTSGAVLVRQVQGGAPFPCRLELELIGATTSVRVHADFGLHPRANEVRVPFVLGEPVERVVIDPDARLLELSPRSALAKERVSIWPL